MFTLAALVLAIDLTASIGAGPTSATGLPTGTTTVETKTMVLLNLGGNFVNVGAVAIGWEIPVAFGGPTRSVAFLQPGVAAGYTETTNLLLTPGLRVRIVPASPLTPWVSAGFGAGRTETVAGAVSGSTVTGAAQDIYHPALSVAGGLDFKFLKHLLLRGEVRNYYLSSFGVGNTVIRSQSRNELLFLGGIGVRF